MNKRFDVVVNCKTWGTGSAEAVSQPTLEDARRLAAQLATGRHGCLIAIEEDDREVEQVRGTRGADDPCDYSERKIIRRMMERGAHGDAIRNRILWAHGHGFLGDEEMVELAKLLAGSAVDAREKTE